MDHDRLAELGCELELRVEEAALGVAGRVVAEVVEARLADGDGPRMREELAQLVEPSGFGAAGLVRMDAERGERRRRAASASASAAVRAGDRSSRR